MIRMLKAITQAAFGLVCIAPLAYAGADGLAACRHESGLAMDPLECKVFQRVAAENDARAAANRAASEQAMTEDATRREVKRLADAEDAKQFEAHAAQRAVIEEQKRAKAEREKQASIDAARRIDEAYDRKVSAQAAVRKAACGQDYLKPQIGMTIERAQECVGTFKVAAQLNRADGVVTTYRGNSTYMHVMNGRVVSWGKY